MLKNFLVATVLLISLNGSCFSAETLLSQKVQDSAGKYKIEFPTDWKVSNGGEYQVDFIAQAPTVGEGKFFVENANIISQELEAITTPREQFNQGLIEIKKLNEFKLGKVEDAKINGLDALVVDYSYVINGNEVKILQYVVIKDKLGIVLTFGSDPTDFKTMKPLFDQIAHTLVLNPRNGS